jgi:hypothetical protein
MKVYWLMHQTSMVWHKGKVHYHWLCFQYDLDLNAVNRFQVSKLTPSDNASASLCFTLKQMYNPVDHASKSISTWSSLWICHLLGRKSMPFTAFKSPTLLQVNASICLYLTLKHVCILWYNTCQRPLTAYFCPQYALWCATTQCHSQLKSPKLTSSLVYSLASLWSKCTTQQSKTETGIDLNSSRQTLKWSLQVGLLVL